MKKQSSVKYLASGVDEFQPGSRRTVLGNLLAIRSKRKVEDAELAAYMEAESDLVRMFTEGHRFALRDIALIHKKFLGTIYSWAGRYRDVNLSKGGFVFASAMAIPQMMKEFERRVLRKHTPCRRGTVDEIAMHLAVVHVEFLLIHPYREGNGRTARLLATLMAYQAGNAGIGFRIYRKPGEEL